MNRVCDIPMDSYRLAHYTVQVECYVCGGGNTFDAEHCRHCQAPMALAHQARSQDVRPAMIAVLGTSGAGKTVFLGMLMDMLSRQTRGIKALVRGAFSVSLQQLATTALSACEFPTKTPNEPDRWNWVHCQVTTKQNSRHPLELIVPDMAGEAVLQEIEHPNTFPVVRSFLSKASGIVVLVDAIRLEQGGLEQDHFSMKLLSFLGELDKEGQPTRKRRKQHRSRPVALVLTKADQCENCFDDPDAFAQTFASGMWRQCAERFDDVKIFASGVAGACAFRYGLGDSRRRIPLRVEPRGIVEPFEWIVSKLPLGRKA